MTKVNHSKMKLGKKLGVVVDRRTLQLERYLDKAALPEIPERHHVAQMDDWDMLGNDAHGDCGPAACGHSDMAWDRGVRNREPKVTTADVIDLYSRVSGYDPATGANDNGVYMLDLMNEWRRGGLAGEKIRAYAQVNHSNFRTLRQAIWLFGGVQLGFALPVTAQRQEVWDVEGDGTGDSAPGSWGGHAVYAVGYWEKGGIDIITWGQRKRVTDSFMSRYCDEAYCALSPDWIKRNGKSPRGVAVDDLLADLKEVTR